MDGFCGISRRSIFAAGLEWRRGRLGLLAAADQVEPGEADEQVGEVDVGEVIVGSGGDG